PMCFCRRAFGSVPLLMALVFVVAAGRNAPPLLAQQHPSRIVAGLEALQIRPNVYVIFGAGANVTVHVGDDGLVVVDSGSTEMAETLLKAVASISPRPIRLIGHPGADAVQHGGTGVLGAAGVRISPD